jgi:hypothetical protein
MLAAIPRRVQKAHAFSACSIMRRRQSAACRFQQPKLVATQARSDQVAMGEPFALRSARRTYMVAMSIVDILEAIQVLQNTHLAAVAMMADRLQPVIKRPPIGQPIERIVRASSQRCASAQAPPLFTYRL